MYRPVLDLGIVRPALSSTCTDPEIVKRARGRARSTPHHRQTNLYRLPRRDEACGHSVVDEEQGLTAVLIKSQLRPFASWRKNYFVLPTRKAPTILSIHKLEHFTPAVKVAFSVFDGAKNINCGPVCY